VLPQLLRRAPIEVTGFDARPRGVSAPYVWALATVAPPPRQSEAESVGIAANPCASGSFWALAVVPNNVVHPGWSAPDLVNAGHVASVYVSGNPDKSSKGVWLLPIEVRGVADTANTKAL